MSVLHMLKRYCTSDLLSSCYQEVLCKQLRVWLSPGLCHFSFHIFYFLFDLFVRKPRIQQEIFFSPLQYDHGSSVLGICSQTGSIALAPALCATSFCEVEESYQQTKGKITVD